ncbi:MAG: VCBS repeat-containing protein, partial [Balneolaceae bacterium]|nr:VCBS repeat-containing protein [Balneolaceae bacterium]
MENTPEFNIQNYLYFYDGGGVAAGDINNDGLTDLFFTGNSVADRLYLNKGDFEFEDITESAGFIHEPDSWSTGVTMADINGDNYLDIYVSRVNYLNKSGVNQLFINNGDSTFTERAEEFGLDFEGYSTQAAFFDYDNDGDLDMFLLNHSFHSENTYGEAAHLRQQQDPKAGDKLFRNDGDIFTDVTGQAGIISSALGYGLGVAVTDINRDGWMDIYVGNDFHEDDYLYINNGDGTFSESLYQMMGHTSSASMGNDTGDINNDGLTDLVSLDMMPNGHEEFMT